MTTRVTKCGLGDEENIKQANDDQVLGQLWAIRNQFEHLFGGDRSGSGKWFEEEIVTASLCPLLPDLGGPLPVPMVTIGCRTTSTF